MSARFDTFGPPAPPPDPWALAAGESSGAGDDNDEPLDPGAAAALLEQSRLRAKRAFDLRPPWLKLVAAAVVLVVYGVVWLSVRHQHPYRAPAGWALAVLYGTLAAWIVLLAVVLRRATTGVGGRAARQRWIEGTTFTAIWICVYIVQGALDHAGAGKAIVFGIWPAAGPLIIVGSASAAYEVGRGRQTSAAFAAAVALLGACACFAGPDGVWGVIGAGLSALCLVGAATQLLQRRAQAGG